MQNGTIKFFDHSRGFGFIKMDDGEDVFCHISSFPARNVIITTGDKVCFDVVDDNRGKGKQAVNVQLVGRT